MDTPSTYLLSVLESHKNMTDHRVTKIINEWAKDKRKGKTKKEVRDCGLEIYNEESVEILIDQALQGNLVEVTDITEHGRQLQLTGEGRLNLAIYLSNNFSNSFKEYSERFARLLKEHQVLPPTKMNVMRRYHAGWSPEMLLENYLKEKSTPNSTVDYHKHLIHEVAGKNPNITEEYIFHLAPRLFVPSDLRGRKVKLEIQGLSEPFNIIVSSPYTNKHYYVAGMKQGRTNTAGGFYPIIAKKEHFPVHKELILHWLIDDQIRIDHYLEIDFMFLSEQGRLFSTEQQFRRPIAGLNNFTVKTTINRNDLRDRNAKLIVRDIYNHFELWESVTLTNFPLELHNMTKSGSYFSNWHHKWVNRNIEEK